MTRTDRGLANLIILYFATLVFITLMWIVLNVPFDMVLLSADCATEACETGSGWVDEAWDNYFWLALLSLFIMLVSRAIAERGRGGV